MGGLGSTGLIFIGIGALSAIIAVLLYMRTRRFLEDAVAVQGTVTGLSAHSSSEGGTTYSPIVQFTTVEGQAHTFTESVSSNPPRYQPGATVKVLYPPANPQKARVQGWFGLWYLPAFSALFALIFLGVGIPLSLADDAVTTAAQEGIPSEISSLLPSLEPGELPEGLPSIDIGAPPGSGPILVINDGSGVPRTLNPTCDSLRDTKGGKVREVKLSFDGGTLTFTASPFTGPGPYVAGTSLEVGGSVLQDGEISGAAIFDETGTAGVVNLVAGTSTVSGAWECSEQH